MRTVIYKCEESGNNSICAEPVTDDDSGLLDSIEITMTAYSDEHRVYLTREDALHFAETLKTMAEAPNTPKKLKL